MKPPSPPSPPTTAKQKEQRRFRAIAALQRGMSEREVADLLATSVASVNQWKRRFHTGGLGQLAARPPGRPRRGALTIPGIDQVVDTLFASGPEALGRQSTGRAPGLWDWRAVQALIARTCGLDMSRWTVLRHLGEWGLSAPPILASARRSAGDDVDRWLDQAYPPIKTAARRAGGLVYFVETTTIARPDSNDAGIAHDVFWTLRPRGEAAFMIYRAPSSPHDVIDFLARVAASSPTPAHLIVSDEAAYRRPEFAEWLVRDGRVRLHAFAPEGASRSRSPSMSTPGLADPRHSEGEG